MITAIFRYTNGTELTKEFVDLKALYWFAYNEGDHLVGWKLYEASNTPGTLSQNGTQG